jgi:hypothetical protein
MLKCSMFIRSSHRMDLSKKQLDPDCLLEGDLHPSIRLRLERVRELPVKGVANLRGVERVGQDVFALWERVEGRTLQDVAATAGPEQIARILREAALIVSAMHGAGIVHGAVHVRNIIIDDTGGVKLTHVSPLLFEDEQVDRDALADLRTRFGADGTPTAGGHRGATKTESAGATKGPGATTSAGAGDPEFALRRRALAAAAVVATAGIAMAATIAWYVTRASIDATAAPQQAIVNGK